MQHPVLGSLEEERGCWVGRVMLDGTSIALRLDPDDEGIGRTVSLAVRLVSALAFHDAAARDLVARDLLETYNAGWNEYDEIQEDGSIVPVVNPTLDPEAFKQRLVLSSLDVDGEGGVRLWYADGGLFWGHRIYVQSLEGDDLSNAHAQLFG